MKKLLPAALLSLAVLSLTAAQAPAGYLFHHCCHSCCYSYVIKCKPYNAFSPFCSGQVCCDGCCPMPPAPCGPAPCAPSCAPDCGPACGDGSCLGQLPAPSVPPTALPPTPGYQPPAPTPAPNGTSQMWSPPMPQAPVQTTAYSQPSYNGYNYGYAPMPNYGYGYGYAAAMQQAAYNPYAYGAMVPTGNVPYYWNAGR